MFSINITPANLDEIVQPSKGLKGLTLFGDTKQYLEPSRGFKGISFEVETGGCARKIAHFEYYVPTQPVTYAFFANSYKDIDGVIWIGFWIESSDATLNYSKSINISVTVSYVKDGGVTPLNNLKYSIPAGQRSIVSALPIADTTGVVRIIFSFLSVTPYEIFYNNPTVIDL
ncbi:hypothetical protein ABDD95_15635 [Mucilaginibacter sp. PAMB04274]|uniref:hypothetical protein n=1 Tax=Mucilaginibacter sp. PAMB04274 TaxID=3138568 RepID=UPI0031F62EB2